MVSYIKNGLIVGIAIVVVNAIINKISGKSYL